MRRHSHRPAPPPTPEGKVWFGVGIDGGPVLTLLVPERYIQLISKANLGDMKLEALSTDEWLELTGLHQQVKERYHKFMERLTGTTHR